MMGPLIETEDSGCISYMAPSAYMVDFITISTNCYKLNCFHRQVTDFDIGAFTALSVAAANNAIVAKFDDNLAQWELHLDSYEK